MHYKATVVIGAIGFASFACTLAGEDERDTLIEIAEDRLLNALAAYSDCKSATDAACAAEARELVDAGSDLHDALGDQAWTFRASATADCGNGVSVTCHGTSCNALDAGGCSCYSGNVLQSYAYCPDEKMIDPSPKSNH